MPKTPSDRLYRLIHALSSSEKRYFKLFVGRESDRANKYIVLFDAIEAQPEFDENALKEAVYGTTEIPGRKYSELKSYLYDLVLRSLQGYDSKSSVEYQLKSMLQSVQALFRRSLFSACLAQLARAKKQAYRYERFTVVLECLNWEKQIAYTQSDIDFLNDQLERIDEEETTALQRLRNISRYRNIFFRLLVLLRKGSVSNPSERAIQLEAIVQDELMQDAASADSHHAQTLYYRILSIYEMAAGNFDRSYDYSRKLITHMEAAPHFLKEDVSEYISALSNLILSCGKLGQYQELETWLEQLNAVRPVSKDDELKVYRQYYQNKFALCIARGDFEEGVAALDQHLKKRRQFDQSLFQTPTFYYNYFYITFGAEQYERALGFLNDWLNLPATVERQDLQTVARLLNLLVHYELGNHVLLESLIRSTQRYLRKNKMLYEMERKIINFIKSASEAGSRQALVEECKLLKEEFEERGQPGGTRTFLTRAFNMVAWLDSKITGQPFAQVIQQKTALRSSE